MPLVERDLMIASFVIFNHTTGDTHIPFSKLGKSLKLPQTAILALQAPEQ